MNKELGLLNFVCILVALGFVALAVISVLASGDFLTTDNLFIITVSLMMALLFAINPLLYLRLPVPFVKKSVAAPAGGDWGQIRSSHTPPLLDARGRAMPPDVKEMVARMGQPEVKD
jgi:hypothetical protein